MDTSQPRNLLNNQPVWIVLITLPRPEAIENSKEDMLCWSSANWATEISNTLINHLQQNSPIIAIPYIVNMTNEANHNIIELPFLLLLWWCWCSCFFYISHLIHNTHLELWVDTEVVSSALHKLHEEDSVPSSYSESSFVLEALVDFLEEQR